MQHLQYLIVTIIYLIFGTLLIVITAQTKPVQDLTHIRHLLNKNTDKAIHKFLHIPSNSVIITRVNTIQRLLCPKSPGPKSPGPKSPGPKSKVPPQCKNIHKDTSTMHKESEKFQNLQTCALTVGFILVFFSLFRFLTLLVN